MSGFKFANKHNEEDMNAPMLSKSIQPPSKKKNKVDLPFTNGSYDFSTVGSNGEITYTERLINVSIGIPTDSKEQLYVWYTNIINWLMDSGKDQLVFDDIIDFYFLAEVESAPTFEELITLGAFDITFTADPFKSGVSEIGSEAWDTFNFELDYMQTNKFEITGSKIIQLYNPGRAISPKVNCSSSMTVSNNGHTANFISGDNYDWNFKLQKGINNISVDGTGTIKIIFRKEML